MTPRRERQLATALHNYTNPSKDVYDPEFTKQIRKEAPDWFRNPVGNKEQLLEIARSGKDRPMQGKHPLGLILSSYTIKSGNSYDPDFDTKIRELRPDWFRTGPGVKEKKEQLLKMARSGEDKPHWKSSLGRVLYHYISKSGNSYDPDFDTKIRKLRPDWFKR